MQLIFEPLQGGTASDYGSFQGIVYATFHAPANGGQHAVRGVYGLVAGIHQDGTAGSHGDFGHAGFKTAFAKGGCVRISYHGSDGYGIGE